MTKFFIGSSYRMLPLVDEIAGYLKSDGHEPWPWNKAFEHGDITIDKLLDMAPEVHGAILVFSGDDEIISAHGVRQSSSEGRLVSEDYPRQSSPKRSPSRKRLPKVNHAEGARYQPRGNVLLEFGLFLGYLGRRRAIICNHGDNRKPSDLDGLTYLDLGSKPDHLSQEAQNKLRAWAADLSRGPDIFGGDGGITQVFSNFPLGEFRKELRKAKCLHILQTFIPYTQHLHHFEADLMDAIKRGCEVQILLLSPWSFVVELRQHALEPGYGRVGDEIRANLRHFAALWKELPADQRDRLAVRVHAAMPSMSIYQVDNRFYSGHYFQGNLAIDSPQLRVTNPQSSMGQRLVKEHDRIWKADATAEVDLANIETWLRNGPPR